MRLSRSKEMALECALCDVKASSYTELATHLMDSHKQIATDYLVAFLVSLLEGGNHA